VELQHSWNEEIVKCAPSLTIYQS